ncbi:pre-mRNA-processing factor 31 [Monosporozyma servazzii]
MSDIEEDFLNDLDEDLDAISGSEDEEEEEAQINSNKIENFATSTMNTKMSLLTSLFDQKNTVAYFKELQSLCRLARKKPHDVKDPYELTTVGQEHSHVIELLNSGDKSNFMDILPILNDILVVVKDDLESLHTFLALTYHEKFPELESLLPNLVEYANCIRTLELTDDLSDNNINTALLNDAKLTKEQILVLTMTIKTGYNKYVNSTTIEKDNLLKAVALTNHLNEINTAINEYMNVNVHLIAPNLTAIIGPKVASLLIGHAGGILKLSEIPSCNLASIGKKKYQSHTQQTNFAGVRQEGYIYHSKLIQSQDIGSHKQMLRMLCAKIALAARVDASQSNNIDPSVERNDSLGVKWRDEIVKKIIKLREAPLTANSKVLPIPEDKPKKKRAGRKFRKYKEQFKMSHLRQLQNRTEFGKQESTILDAYGEEIGLGMSKTSLNGPVESSRYTGNKINNKAKLTKNMKSRIKDANEQSNEYLLSVTNDQLELTTDSELPAAKRQKPSDSNEWYSRHL